MSVAPVILSPLTGAQLPGGSASILMTPVAAATQITSAVFVNSSNSAVEVITIYLVRSGGAPGPLSQIIPGQSLAPNQTFVSPELRGRNLEVGDALYGFATDAGVVNFVVDGVTFS